MQLSDLVGPLDTLDHAKVARYRILLLPVRFDRHHRSRGECVSSLFTEKSGRLIRGRLYVMF
jgi:hypothetical protein